MKSRIFTERQTEETNRNKDREKASLPPFGGSSWSPPARPHFWRCRTRKGLNKNDLFE